LKHDSPDGGTDGGPSLFAHGLHETCPRIYNVDVVEYRTKQGRPKATPVTQNASQKSSEGRGQNIEVDGGTKFKIDSQENKYKKLSYCWETVRRESMPRIAEMGVEMTT